MSSNRQKVTANLMMVGASVRSASWSARRAGLTVVAGDCFGDADLRSIAKVEKVSDYPAGLLQFARRHPGIPWLYTGGLENYPDLVQAISESNPLLGNSPETLHAVRDPFALATAFHGANLPFATVRRRVTLEEKGIWLRKAYQSCGGTQIQIVRANGATRHSHADFYYQELVPGESISAVYVGHRNSVALLGVTDQLVGTSWAGASNFVYVGSIGPRTLDAGQQAKLTRLGEVAVSTFGLRGLFGVDAIHQSNGTIVPIEVNPRYTASMEILERGLGINAIATHLNAFPCCVGKHAGGFHSLGKETNRLFGKAILYAQKDVIFEESTSTAIARSNIVGSWPQYADIPTVGTKIGTGRPVCTAFASANSEDQVKRRLIHRLDWLRKQMQTDSDQR